MNGRMFLAVQFEVKMAGAAVFNLEVINKPSRSVIILVHKHCDVVREINEKSSVICNQVLIVKSSSFARNSSSSQIIKRNVK